MTWAGVWAKIGAENGEKEGIGMERDMRRTWAEIDLGALAHNYHTLRAMLPRDCRLLAPVKAELDQAKAELDAAIKELEVQ